MIEKAERNQNDARKVLKKSRESKRQVFIWGFASLSALLIVVAALYVFVWRAPKQPDAPDNMVVAQTPAPVAEHSSMPTAVPTPIVTTKPIATPKPLVVQDSFKDLFEQNSDIVGWISVDNTIIDYPILQSADNGFYMEKDFYKEYSYPGSIFLDFRCDFNNMFKAAHQIIYGHNMKNGTMFQQLTKYQDEAFFNENRYINVNTLYGNYVFEVFAAYETPISFYYLETSFTDRGKWLEFITVFQDKSAFETDIVLAGNDVVITLSTCTNDHDDNDRFVVHARLTNPEEYATVYDYMYQP